MRKGQYEIFSTLHSLHERLIITLGKYRKFIWVFVVFLVIGLFLHNSFGLIWEHRLLATEKIQKGIGYPGTHAYSIPLGTTWMGQDKRGTSAPAQVLEDGGPLAFSDSLHAEIAEKGAGRYSLWGGNLYFSSSDNSDPRTNLRRYQLYWPTPVNPVLVWMVYMLALFMTLSMGYSHRRVLSSLLAWFLKIIEEKKYAIGFIIFISLLFHIVYMLAMPLGFLPDTDSYLQGVFTLINEFNLSGIGIQRGPGLALLLSPIFAIFQEHTLWPLKIFYHLLGIACVVLTYCISWEITHKGWFAFISGIWAAIWFDALYYSSFVSSEIPSCFFIMLFVYWTIKYLRNNRIYCIYLAMLASSCAALIRAENTALLLVFGILVGVLWFWNIAKQTKLQRWRHLVHFFIAFTVAVFPLVSWSYYNYQRTGFFKQSLFFGVTIYDGVIPVGKSALGISVEDVNSPAVKLIQEAVNTHKSAVIAQGGIWEENRTFGINAWYDIGSVVYWLKAKEMSQSNKIDQTIPVAMVLGSASIKTQMQADKILEQAAFDSIKNNVLLYIKMQLIKVIGAFPNGISDLPTSLLPGEVAAFETCCPFYKNDPTYQYYLAGYDKNMPFHFFIKLQRLINKCYSGIFYSPIKYVFNIYWLLWLTGLSGFVVLLARKPFLMWALLLVVTFGKTIFPLLISAFTSRISFQGGMLYLIIVVAVVSQIGLNVKLFLSRFFHNKGCQE